MTTIPEGSEYALSAEYRECGICRSTLNKPKILQCLHVFCTDCIWSKSRAISVGYEINCPICEVRVMYTKESLHSVNFLKTLQAVMTIQGPSSENTKKRQCEFCNEAAPAVFLCLECKVNLCGPCQAIHDKVKGTENHRSYRFIDSNLQEICRKRNDTHCNMHHDEIVTHQCSTCSLMICVVCDLTDHQGHKKRPLVDVATEAREELYSLGTVLKSFHKLANNDQSALVEEFSKDNGIVAVRNIENKIQQTVTDLQDTINTLADELKIQAKKRIEDDFKTLSKYQTETKKRLDQTKTSANFPEQLSNYGSDIEVVNILALVRDTVRHFQKNQQPNEAPVQYFPKLITKSDTIVSIGKLIPDKYTTDEPTKEDQDETQLDERKQPTIKKLNVPEMKRKNTPAPTPSPQVVVHSPPPLGRQSRQPISIKPKSSEPIIKGPPPRTKRTPPLWTPIPDTPIPPTATPVPALPISRSTRNIEDVPLHISTVAKVIRTFNAQWDITKVIVDPDNNYLVASRLDRIPSVYTTHGKLVRKLDMFDGKPFSLAILRNGNYIFTDKDAEKVGVCTSLGVKLTNFPDKSITQPTGVCVDRRDNIIVCDAGANDVMLFMNDTHFPLIKSCSSENGGKIVNSPNDVACSAKGDIIVVDSDDHCASIFDENLILRNTYGSYGDSKTQLKCPRGVCIDKKNRILIADYYNDRLVMASVAGEFLQIIVDREQEILGPRSVAIDHDGHIVLGQENGKIKVIEY